MNFLCENSPTLFIDTHTPSEEEQFILTKGDKYGITYSAHGVLNML